MLQHGGGCPHDYPGWGPAYENCYEYYSSSSTSTSNTNIGLIVGAVIGGVIVLTIVIVLGVYFYIKKQREQRRKEQASIDAINKKDNEVSSAVIGQQATSQQYGGQYVVGGYRGKVCTVSLCMVRWGIFNLHMGIRCILPMLLVNSSKSVWFNHDSKLIIILMIVCLKLMKRGH